MHLHMPCLPFHHMRQRGQIKLATGLQYFNLPAQQYVVCVPRLLDSLPGMQQINIRMEDYPDGSTQVR